MASTYDLYCSYQEEQLYLVRDLMKRVEKDLNIKIWVDIDEIPAGQNYVKNTAEAIMNSKVFLAFITKRYLDSRLFENELEFAFSKHKTHIYVLLEFDVHKRLDFYIGVRVPFNAYNEANCKDVWSEELYQKLLNDVQKSLEQTNNYRPISARHEITGKINENWRQVNLSRKIKQNVNEYEYVYENENENKNTYEETIYDKMREINAKEINFACENLKNKKEDEERFKRNNKSIMKRKFE